MQRYCERCDKQVEAAYEDPKLRRWVKAYFLLGLPFLPALPIIGADFMVMLPLLMLYIIGFGPALRVLREPPTCDECGAVVDHRAR
jgi:hypothetical protein